MASSDKFIGRILGPYTLQDLLGKGGMGTVYRAVDAAGATVAVKILPVDEESASSTMAARFKREIQACLETKSVHVIKLFEAGTEPDCHWYSMELLEGRTLQQVVKARGRLPISEVGRVCREISLALEHIHERGIIHRDLKPGNLMIVRSGRTVLMDFGLAKVADRTRITKTGHGLGTPRYMAPEMLLAKPPTPATDIYQLGVILYELLTGKNVIQAKSFATLAHELTRVYPAPVLDHDPSLSPELDNLVFNCIEKDQALRYQSAAEFRADLERALKGEPVARRGKGRVLNLGESSPEVDTDELTLVENQVPQRTPLPPDSRGSGRAPRVAASASGSRPSVGADGRPRFSAGFSSVAPAVDDGEGLVGALARRAGHPGAKLAAGLAVLAVAGAGYRLTRWAGSTALRGGARVELSPSGAEVVYETEAAVPGVVRLRRYLGAGAARRLDEATRDYRAAEPGARRRHRVALPRLVGGRSYAAELLFPDGVGRHRLEFTVPEETTVDGLALSRGAGGAATLRFALGFPVGGRVRFRAGGAERVVELAPPRKSRHEVAIEAGDVFRTVEGLTLELTGAAGWGKTYGEFSMPGLDGELTRAFSELDVGGMIAEVEAARQGGEPRVLPRIRAALDARGVPAALGRLRAHAQDFFTRPEIPYPRRRGLFTALGRLAPIDFYCVALNLPPLLEVGRLTEPFCKVGSRLSFELLRGVVPKEWRRSRVLKAGAVPTPLVPVGEDPVAYQQTLARPIPGVRWTVRPRPQLNLETLLPTPRPPAVTLAARVANFRPGDYMAVRVNGALTLNLHTPEPDRVLAASEGRDLEAATVFLAVDLPPEALGPGRNELEFSLVRLTPGRRWPTWIRELDVYYRRGGR